MFVRLIVCLQGAAVQKLLLASSSLASGAPEQDDLTNLIRQKLPRPPARHRSLRRQQGAPQPLQRAVHTRAGYKNKTMTEAFQVWSQKN